MTVVAIAAILLAIAVPSMRDFLLNNRMTSAANDILTAVYSARTESVKRRVQAVLCFTSTPDAATPNCDGDATRGWIVFIDDKDSNPAVADATDGNGMVDANEQIVLRHAALDSSFSTKSMPAGNKGYIAFSPTGLSRQIGSLGTGLSGVVLCDSRGNVSVSGPDNSAARGILISQMGRPQITRSVTTIAGDANLSGCP